MLWPKKIHTRNLITKKNSCGSKIPLPPITFLMVRPLQSYNCFLTCDVTFFITPSKTKHVVCTACYIFVYINVAKQIKTNRN